MLQQWCYSNDAAHCVNGVSWEQVIVTVCTVIKIAMKVQNTFQQSRHAFFVAQWLLISDCFIVATQKKLLLAKKYTELKKSGSLNKFIAKKRKKNASRDRKQLPFKRTVWPCRWNAHVHNCCCLINSEHIIIRGRLKGSPEQVNEPIFADCALFFADQAQNIA